MNEGLQRHPGSMGDAGSLPAPPDIWTLLHGRFDEVIAEWKRLIEPEPWAPRSPARIVNALPEILPRLFRLARAGAHTLDQEAGEIIAKKHGYFRRDDGVPLMGLAEEWNHLKRACWNTLQDTGADPQVISIAMQRLDALIDDAIGFSLRGYYSPELSELRGRGLERRTGAGERRESHRDRRSGDDPAEES